MRVVVVRGAGHSFSAGLDRRDARPAARGDVARLLELDDAGVSAAIDDYQQGFTWLRDPRFVSIAAVQGYAIGAGFQLALSCDLRVVTDDAQFCMKESALGLVPDLTGTKPLVEAVGYARALEICATARMVGAAEAVDIGLALTAVPADRAGRHGRRPRAALSPPRSRARCRETKAAAAERGGRPTSTSSAGWSERPRPGGSGSWRPSWGSSPRLSQEQYGRYRR